MHKLRRNVAAAALSGFLQKARKMNDLKEVSARVKGSRRASAGRRRNSRERSTRASSMRPGRYFWGAGSRARAWTRSPCTRRKADDLCPLGRQAGPPHRRGDAVLSRIAQFNSAAPTGGTIEERLAHVGIALLHWTLENERMALMRLAIAEAQRFPDLASTVSRAARQLSTEVAARFLGEMAQSGELGTLPAPEHLAATARFFLDLVVVPMLLRGLFEHTVETLQAEIGPHVARTVAFFLAGCRQGSGA
jgi:hypothetical protein